ncbi:conserved hypothetical protein [Roseibium sp. TrichSKD4]|uniref:hypothetical protein n=1 Tax=Roseibium sp. TrichSKD4 TaxID=744980 RepID=UPI0001E56F2C|nr:hypothetical protein [Roseibium sp. TrichSKD4]EFO31303.1 conserved hypothetical protein [Roseibium sp. TrichSKD4]
MTFNKWLDTLLEEKGIDLEQGLTVKGPSGPNYMPVGVIVDAIKSAPETERAAIKKTLIMIDFHNRSVVDYLRHLGQAIAI